MSILGRRKRFRQLCDRYAFLDAKHLPPCRPADRSRREQVAARDIFDQMRSRRRLLGRLRKAPRQFVSKRVQKNRDDAGVGIKMDWRGP